MAYFDICETPVGQLLLFANDSAVTRLCFGTSSAFRPSPKDKHTETEILAQAKLELDEYFSGRRRTFDVPLVLPGSSASLNFYERVQRALLTIDYGKCASYRDIAFALGHPQATRAVGTGCARNPIPIFLPCHRVIRSDGSYGKFAGGAAMKKWLLDFEQSNSG